MLKLKIKSELSKSEIQELFSSDYEMEKHSKWCIFKEYTSPRVGLHLYKTKTGLQGYYENGKKNRHGSLHRWKTWLKICVKESETGSLVSCKIIYNPYELIIFLGILFYLLRDLIIRKWGEFILDLVVMIIGFILLNDIFEDGDQIFAEIRKKLC